jgi:spore coat polysaccharide biosynthesis protein SpsF
MSEAAIHFLCDANRSVGFGHLSRCLKLAQGMRGAAIRFEGRFSTEARERIAQQGFADGRASTAGQRAVAVVDIMFDREDMDYYDLARLTAIRRRFARVILLSSALTLPAALPVDVAVGHVLEPASRRRRFRTVSGLAYAPVSDEFRAARGRRGRHPVAIRRAFIGFGASKSMRGVHCVLEGLRQRNFDGRVDLLLSPFSRRHEPALRALDLPYLLRIHANLRSVAPLLRQADVAFGTYGNITFEALCLGTPFVAIAVKDFQLAYAKRLQARGLITCIGKDSDLSAATVADALAALTPTRRASLSRKGRAAVDGRGIERIRALISDEVRRLRHQPSHRTGMSDHRQPCRT